MTKLIVLVAVVAPFVVGCNAGVAPAGASQEEMKASFDKQPLDERARILLDAPGPAAGKAPMIKEMYQKEGKPVPADIEKRLGSSPTGH